MDIIRQLEAEQAPHPDGDVREVGVVAERLPLVDVRDVHLDERDRHGREGIADRHTGVGVGARVEDHACQGAGGVQAAGFVDPVHQLAFVVGLQCRDLSGRAGGRGLRLETADDVRQCRAAIDSRFAGAE